MRATAWRLIERLETFGKPTVYICCILLVVMIGYARYWTGPEYAFSIFYFFPIAIMTWLAGLVTGIVFAVASALSWLMADLKFMGTFSSFRVPFINETLRLAVFLIIVVLVWRLKAALLFQQKLARTDALTGLSNRRAFMEFTALEVKRAGRFNLPLTLLCMDVDGFKSVNDAHGHHGGDRLLKDVAETLAVNIRAIDMAARMGGDEFCVLFSGADEKNAQSIVDKLKDRLTTVMRNNRWSVTFSIGVVTYRQAPSSVDEILYAADQLMYRAKKNGKNNIQRQVIMPR
ncbi:MAG: GGDEF domain-containing protein [Thermodesulfobacteriota bacterium]